MRGVLRRPSMMLVDDVDGAMALKADAALSSESDKSVFMIGGI